MVHSCLPHRLQPFHPFYPTSYLLQLYVMRSGVLFQENGSHWMYSLLYHEDHRKACHLVSRSLHNPGNSYVHALPFYHSVLYILFLQAGKLVLQLCPSHCVQSPYRDILLLFSPYRLLHGVHTTLIRRPVASLLYLLFPF